MKRLYTITALLLLSITAFGEDGARESIGITYRVASSISVEDGDAEIVIEQLNVETEGDGGHELEFENNSDSPQKVTIEASQPLPEGFILKATATDVSGGRSNGWVEVRFNSRGDLIVDIPSGEDEGEAEVEFMGTATLPLPTTTTLSVTYTITAQ